MMAVANQVVANEVVANDAWANQVVANEAVACKWLRWRRVARGQRVGQRVGSS
jgi:hypothetical protein